MGDACGAGHESARVGAADVNGRAVERPLVVHEEPGVGVDASAAQVLWGRERGRVSEEGNEGRRGR